MIHPSTKSIRLLHRRFITVCCQGAGDLGKRTTQKNTKKPILTVSVGSRSYEFATGSDTVTRAAWGLHTRRAPLVQSPPSSLIRQCFRSAGGVSVVRHVASTRPGAVAVVVVLVGTATSPRRRSLARWVLMSLSIAFFFFSSFNEGRGFRASPPVIDHGRMTILFVCLSISPRFESSHGNGAISLAPARPQFAAGLLKLSTPICLSALIFFFVIARFHRQTPSPTSPPLLACSNKRTPKSPLRPVALVRRVRILMHMVAGAQCRH